MLDPYVNLILGINNGPLILKHSKKFPSVFGSCLISMDILEKERESLSLLINRCKSHPLLRSRSKNPPPPTSHDLHMFRLMITIALHLWWVGNIPKMWGWILVSPCPAPYFGSTQICHVVFRTQSWVTLCPMVDNT